MEVDKEFREMKQALEETKEIQVIHGVVLSDYVIHVKPKKGKQKTRHSDSVAVLDIFQKGWEIILKNKSCLITL